MEYVRVEFEVKGSPVRLTREKCTRDEAFALVRSPIVARVEISPRQAQ